MSAKDGTQAAWWRHVLYGLAGETFEAQDALDRLEAAVEERTLRGAAETIRFHKDEARGAVQATKVVDFCANLIDPDKGDWCAPEVFRLGGSRSAPGTTPNGVSRPAPPRMRRPSREIWRAAPMLTLRSKTPVKFEFDDGVSQTTVILQPDDESDAIRAKLQRVLDLEDSQGLPVRQPGAALAAAREDFGPLFDAAGAEEAVKAQPVGWAALAADGSDDLPIAD